MATYVFGDLHGCFDEFKLLLARIGFNAGIDELLLTGDLIGRGPKPVETLSYLVDLKNKCPEKVHAVLGNHDLNFFAVILGLRKTKPRDNLDVVLKSPRLNEYLDFYHHTPLLYVDNTKKLALAHAGIYPMWTIDEAEVHAKVISSILSNPIKEKLFLSNMYADHPSMYEEELKHHDLNYHRFVVNSFTRMRLCNKDMVLDYGHSDCSVKEASEDKIYPWFEFGKPNYYQDTKYTLFFGHWAALNAKCDKDGIIALDTGCVWGNELTCYCVETKKKYAQKALGKVERLNNKK